jgi:C-terminal processing protease CtpA/Prc
VRIIFHLFAEEMSGIFVKSISEGSAADLCKKIQVNDRIVEVCKAQNDSFV